MDTERAHRACEKCTRTKKKCDKALPACSRCTRYVTTLLGVDSSPPTTKAEIPRVVC